MGGIFLQSVYSLTNQYHAAPYMKEVAWNLKCLVYIRLGQWMERGSPENRMYIWEQIQFE